MSSETIANEDIVSWLADNPQIEVLHTAVCDLNGIMRGKRIPIDQARRVAENGIRMPLSIVGVDVWGEDIQGNPMVYKSGDIDGICSPT
jgi:glutamine synthetase